MNERSASLLVLGIAGLALLFLLRRRLPPPGGALDGLITVQRRRLGPRVLARGGRHA